MKQYLLNEEAQKAILNYLTSRPYYEVYQLVGRLLEAQELPLPKAQDEAKDTAQG